MQLPEQWRVVVRDETQALDPSRVTLRLFPSGKVAKSLSMQVFEDGWTGVVGETVSSATPLDILMRGVPTLDEVVAMYLLLARANEEDLGKAAEVLAHYADDVQQGYWPDQVAPEASLQSMFAVVVHDAVDSESPAKILGMGLDLIHHAATSLTDGRNFLTEPVFADAPRWQRALTKLTDDHALYLEDRSRGRTLLATVPGVGSGAQRELPLLILERPVARLFKHWARTDPEAPESNGYPLTLVELAEGEYVLSAKPTARVKLSPLADPLSSAERSKVGESRPWYDGARHEGTLVAQPNEGSALGLDEVVEALRGPLKLRAVPVEEPPSDTAGTSAPGGGARIGLVATAAVVALGVGGYALYASQGNGPGPASGPHPSPTTAADTATPKPEVEAPPPPDLEPMGKTQIAALIDERAENGVAIYAVVAGACNYAKHSPKGSDLNDLPLSCESARAFADRLVTDYGLKRDNLILLTDDLDEHPIKHKPTAGSLASKIPNNEAFSTAENIVDAIGHAADAANKANGDKSTFVFFYSGHGGHKKVGTNKWGALEPSGFDGSKASTELVMRDLYGVIEKRFEANHVLVAIDSCYSGWTAMGADDDHLSELTPFWDKEARIILTAAGTSEQAWQNTSSRPYTYFTMALLEGMKVARGGEFPMAEADAKGNRDFILTGQELGRYVHRRVPELFAEDDQPARQEPSYTRKDNNVGESHVVLFPTPEPRG